MLLAIDAGKTRTTLAYIDENVSIKYIASVLGKKSSLIYPEDTIVKALSEVISDFMKKFNIKNNIKLIIISWADLDTEYYFNKAKRIVTSLSKDINVPQSKIMFEHDAVTAYYAATLGEPGVAVIAGTGAIAFGMNRKGEKARSSGWGWLLGDEGSAVWIALRALNAAVRAYDGRGEPTSLVDRLLKYYNLNNLLNIIDILYSENLNIDDIAALAKIVSEEAERGDEVSIRILREAGIELASAVISVARRLNMINDNIVIGEVGSVFSSRIVFDTFKNAVASTLKHAIIKEPLISYQSIIGPIIMGLRILGHKITQKDYERLITEINNFKINNTQQ